MMSNISSHMAMPLARYLRHAGAGRNPVPAAGSMKMVSGLENVLYFFGRA
jgi:hypothetical protein